MLKLHTRKLDNVAIVCLRGRIVNGETAALRELVAGQSHVKTIILDLAGVTTIDASGLGLMLELRSQTEARGIGFKLMNVSSFVHQVFEITRLDSVLELVPRAEPAPAISSNHLARMPFAACA
jgi:anti-sigma B factor antagonist